MIGRNGLSAVKLTMKISLSSLLGWWVSLEAEACSHLYFHW